MRYLLLLALPLVAYAETKPTKLPALVMTSPDSAKAVYADKCANGGNHDEENRGKFLNLMLANPKSKLAQLKAALLKEIKDDIRDDGVYFGTWQATFRDRDGCGDSLTSQSTVVVTVTGGNSNHTVARYLVSIDDDDRGGVRTLSLRSIQPLKIRDE